MQEKRAETSQQIAEIISKRWSCRSFNPDIQVTREQLISLCEAARWAPSCYGDEPWNFIICDKYSNPESWRKAYQCLSEWNKKWVNNVPVLIISLALKTFRKNGKDNYWSKYDTGAACQNIYLQAVELGLMAHPMGGFDSECLREKLNIPENREIMSIIAIGYQDEPNKLNDEFYQLELNKRKRSQLSELFFNGEFGNNF